MNGENTDIILNIFTEKYKLYIKLKILPFEKKLIFYGKNDEKHFDHKISKTRRKSSYKKTRLKFDNDYYHITIILYCVLYHNVVLPE